MEKVLTKKILCDYEEVVVQAKQAPNASEDKDPAIADRATLVRNDETPLVLQYLSALVPSKRSAFTLAEVLITLGIIGVVAALTIPNAINNARERKKVVKLKKVYAQLSEVYDRATNEKGFIKDRLAKYPGMYEPNSHVAFRNYFMTYFKVIREGDYSNATAYAAEWNYISGTSWIYARDCNTFATFLDNSDTAYIFSLVPNNCTSSFGAMADNIPICGEIFVDLYPNPKSLSKPEWKDYPKRTVGRDIFLFHVTKDSIVPAGVSSDLSECYKRGFACTQWVLLNENMDYLHCNDLSWSGKHKCK